MALPILDLTTCFDSWKAQLNAFFIYKGIADEKQLAILPLAVSQEILSAVLGKIEKTTLKTALDKIETVWLRMSRPDDPSKLFSNVKITSPGEAEKVRTELKKLARYIGFDDHVIAKQMVQAVPTQIRPTVQAYVFSGKHLSSSEVAAFISTLSFPEETHESRDSLFKVKDEKRACRICGKTNHPSYKCFQIRCFNCKAKGHVAKNCPKNE